jgi:hypothetical protein
MADSARHTLHAILEDEYGVTPATPGFTRVRHTGTTLALTKSANTSAELDPNRQIRDFRHGTKQVGGDISFELSFDSFHDYLEAVLCGTWLPKALVEDDTVSVDAAGSTFTDSGNGFILGGFEQGDIIVTSGFTEPANNGTFLVATVAAGAITVTDLDGDPVVLTNESAGAEVSLESTTSVLKAGVERRSFSMLRHFTDIEASGKPFHLYQGVILNNLSLTVTPDAIVTGSFGTVGQRLTLNETAPQDATFSEPPNTRVFDSFTGSLLEDGQPIAVITEIGLTLENGVAPRFVAFSDETILPQIGRSNLTGSVSLYFEDAVMYEKFINEQLSSLEFTLTDKDGNSYRFSLPRISYTGGQPDVSGEGSITLTMPLQAIYDATTDTNITVTRIPV